MGRNIPADGILVGEVLTLLLLLPTDCETWLVLATCNSAGLGDLMEGTKAGAMMLKLDLESTCRSESD